ncbi:MAG: hypothetical protein CMK59_09705 [Proteobacteria bacterium]|nr:hypothetical protein [Pseudomonadota bacterium]
MTSAEIIHWLLTEGRLCTSSPELLKKFGTLLEVELGCDRVWLGTSVLHPQAAGYVWFYEEGTIRERIFSYEEDALLQNIDSPAIRLKNGVNEIHLQAPDADGMQDVEDLFNRGYVDFFALSFFFQGKWSGGITYSSRTPFTQEKIDILRAINPAISAVVEPLTCRLVTSTLLETYLGADAGRRVFLGQVKRGDGQTLRSVIWFSDIRGFTRMSERLELNQLLETLNSAFEQVVKAVEANGGQVLKFIGDGLLAVFPCDQGDAQACEAARKAATQLSSNLSEVEVGVGLHLGDVNYGNIGAPGRLDFTVIGSDVNLAARVESQTGKLGQMMLATPAVAKHGSWKAIEKVSLKGVAQPVVLYAPND